jgi:hypothetical protein
MMKFKEVRKQNQNSLLILLLSLKAAGYKKVSDNFSELIIFLAQYSFLFENSSDNLNSCAAEQSQLLILHGDKDLGARYLDPKTSLWLSSDPALKDYIPLAPTNDEAKKHNQNLPGMGGVFNLVNLHLYHYAGNNPVKYTDTDGRIDKHYLAKGIALIAEGALQVKFGQALKFAAYGSILVNPAAPAVIDRADQIINEGQVKIEQGEEIVAKAWLADSIGKGHAYKKHAKKRGEFKSDGISGNGTLEDKEKLVSLISGIIIDGKAEHIKLGRGREAYWDDKNQTVVIIDPNREDKGTAFKPWDGKAYFDDELE